jgi:hypothetical protein
MQLYFVFSSDLYSVTFDVSSEFVLNAQSFSRVAFRCYCARSSNVNSCRITVGGSLRLVNLELNPGLAKRPVRMKPVVISIVIKLGRPTSS